MTKPKVKPDLTYNIKAYAMKQASRLKEQYPEGLTSRDLSHELNMTCHVAVSTMNNYGFHQWDKRFAIGDVAAMLAYRHYKRMKRLKGLI